MKILDRYILKTYLKTFISVFLILMLIFVLQTIWLFIKELAGKDLDLVVVLKFLLYYSPKLIPLVLPLTILLASIMVFGSFAENYEFAAMKSTGTSLQRAMAGLGIFIGILGITTFFFSNSVIPWGEYNSYNLRNNIKKLKPAMAIAEGQFNDVGNINIKVEEKSGLNGKDLKGVVIHEKSNSAKGNKNYRTIVSKTGELVGDENSSVLKLILHDGYFYDDTPPSDYKAREKNPLVKSSFKTYTFNLDLSEENSQDLDEKNISDKYSMLNVSDLNYTIDSLAVESKKEYDVFAENLYNRSQIAVLNTGLIPKKETTFTGDILDLFDTKKKIQLLDLAINTTNSTKQVITTKEKFLNNKQTNYNKHVVALHEKFALGFACIILFFVGAPLGALIRKGGIGLPMVIAILLFLTYHFIGIFAKNSASNGSVNPVIAPWISTIVMLPLGIFLTQRATADRGLFEFDHIIEPLKKLFKTKAKSKTEIAKTTENSLIKPENLDKAKSIYKNYTFHSNTAFTFYITGLILTILFFVFNNNKLPNFATASIQLSIISFVMLLIYYIKSFLNLHALYALIDKKANLKKPIELLLGWVVYPLTYFLKRNKITEDFSNTLK
ncbi:LptF/LptG family permease [Lacinutrix sp. C3R15]|uniref:LptF/LptG family permease n=1 Tax=Flavobacteriaceae TaxID=49546 RepID=UPI001C09C0F0|nr:LptF/LptG family permease [Oceanihabitans sp. 1_MG-2023]MBU2940546.1 LptF/LptG family permease [Lacinutrix sp. C3R15]MDO6623866.1 LptF/LptG family permease [Oceanihabitans sp. 1_MG-2023]